MRYEYVQDVGFAQEHGVPILAPDHQPGQIGRVVDENVDTALPRATAELVYDYEQSDPVAEVTTALRGPKS